MIYPSRPGNSSMVINSLGESCDTNKSPVQFGSLSNFVGHHNKKDENVITISVTKEQVSVAYLLCSLFSSP